MSFSPYRFHLRFASSVDHPHSSARYRMPDSGFSLSAQGISAAPTAASDSDAPDAPGAKGMPVSYKGRQVIMSVQGYSSDDYPQDFAQDHKSLSYPMSSELDQHACRSSADAFYCDDGIMPDYISGFDAPRFYQGSWDGRCVAQRPEESQYNKCKMFVRIVGVEIEQHVTGEECPSEMVGRKAGFIKVLERDEMIPLLSTDQQSVLLFSQIVVLWHHGATASEDGKWIRAIITTGKGRVRSEDDVLKIIWAEPGDAEWPPAYSWLDTNLPGCVLSQYRQVTPAEHRIQPFRGVSESVRLQGASRRRIAFEVKSVAACNASLTRVYELGAKSAACKRLVETLLLHDTLAMLPPSLSGSLCSSACKSDLDGALDESLEVCSAGWRQDWKIQSYFALLFKQRLTLATMRYWMTLDCSSNRHRTSCLSAAAMPAFLADTACQSYVGKRLPPVHPFVDMKCSQACRAALDAFVKDEHCCVSSLEDADRMYFSILYHPGMKNIAADLRDRADPFDLNVGNNNTLYSLVADPAANVTHWPGANDSSNGIGCATSARVSGQCAATHYCASSNWEPSCCDGLACVKGYKHYPGACRCVCPPGFSGRYASRNESCITHAGTHMRKIAHAT